MAAAVIRRIFGVGRNPRLKTSAKKFANVTSTPRNALVRLGLFRMKSCVPITFALHRAG
jgi:hypothetical protein